MKKQWKLSSILLLFLIVMMACSSSLNSDQDSEKVETQADSDEVELTISAAASLSDAMDEIQEMYKEKNPEVSLRFNFGSSGSLQQQIVQGAPVDLFFSAAEDKFEQLVEEGMIIEEDGIDLLGNELVLVVKKGNETIHGFDDLVNVDTFSIGTPETVPAGKYAKESLEKMKLWDDVESKLVPAKDVRQVLSYVATGNVDAGIVYKTDALVSEQVEIVATADVETHSPIVYPVGMIKDSVHYEAAKDFYEYLQSDGVLKVFEKYGFITR